MCWRQTLMNFLRLVELRPPDVQFDGLFSTSESRDVEHAWPPAPNQLSCPLQQEISANNQGFSERPEDSTRFERGQDLSRARLGSSLPSSQVKYQVRPLTVDSSKLGACPDQGAT